MEPFSITASSIALAATIGKTSYHVVTFIRAVRDARADMDAISKELVSLKTALEILADDTNTPGVAIPESLEKQVQSIIQNCLDVISQLDGALKKYEGEKAMTKVKWTWKGRDEMDKYRIMLAAHKGALDLAIDLTALSITREIKTDTEAIREDTADIKNDTEQILAEIAKLQALLPQTEVGSGIDGSGLMLQKYLDNLTSYAETAYAGSVHESQWDSDVRSEGSINTVNIPEDDVLTSEISVAVETRPATTEDTSDAVATNDSRVYPLAVQENGTSQTTSQISIPELGQTHRASGTPSPTVENPEASSRNAKPAPVAEVCGSLPSSSDTFDQAVSKDEKITTHSPGPSSDNYIVSPELPLLEARAANMHATEEFQTVAESDSAPKLPPRARRSSPLSREASGHRKAELDPLGPAQDLFPLPQRREITIPKRMRAPELEPTYAKESRPPAVADNALKKAPSFTSSSRSVGASAHATPSVYALTAGVQIVQKLFRDWEMDVSVFSSNGAIHIDGTAFGHDRQISVDQRVELIKTFSTSGLGEGAVNAAFRFADGTTFAVIEAVLATITASRLCRGYVEELGRKTSRQKVQAMEWLDFLLRFDADLTMAISVPAGNFPLDRTFQNGAEFGDTALDIAIKNWAVAREVVEKLLDAGALIEGPATFEPSLGFTHTVPRTLRRAVSRIPSSTRLEFVKLIVSRGIDITKFDEHGLTLLHGETNVGVISFLVQNGVDVNHNSAREGTPLHRAIENRNFEVIETLLRLGANPRIAASVRYIWTGGLQRLGKSKWEHRIVTPIEMAEQMKVAGSETRKELLDILQNSVPHETPPKLVKAV